LALFSGVSGFPLFERYVTATPVIKADFADPSILLYNQKWYAFATGAYGAHVQFATSDSFLSGWHVNQGYDALPNLPAWVRPDNPTGSFVWAPDVVKRASPSRICKAITKDGAAVSDGTSPKGPYRAQSNEPLACNEEAGGSIDPAGFKDKDGQNYVVYKVDGNSKGNGGVCNNSKPPIKSTPIKLQKLRSNLITPDGDPKTILDRDDNDGPLVEAPSINYKNGLYYLFFSSNCYSTPQYDVSFATAQNVWGPYTKAHAPDAPLLVTSKELSAPGGADVSIEGTYMAFHGNIGNRARGMYVATIKEVGGKVTV
ncbi:MAG: hypothetical protein Q9179_005376, partial [Wetmoreana sp. 5 TL-2023]